MSKVFDIAFRLGASVNSSLKTAFATATRNVNQLNDQSSTLGQTTAVMSKGMGVAKGAILGIGTAAATAAASLGVAMKAADEYTGAMRQIQASTGTSAAGMKEIQQISKDLYNKNLGEDWNDLADAIMKTKTVTGLTGKELKEATANAIVYRDVWGEDISQSIKASDTMVKNFGVTSTQAFNLLAQGAQRGLNKSDELIDSANEYAPYFAKLGFSANQMFDTFSAGLANG